MIELTGKCWNCDTKFKIFEISVFAFAKDSRKMSFTCQNCKEEVLSTVTELTDPRFIYGLKQPVEVVSDEWIERSKIFAFGLKFTTFTIYWTSRCNNCGEFNIPAMDIVFLSKYEELTLKCTNCNFPILILKNDLENMLITNKLGIKIKENKYKS